MTPEAMATIYAEAFAPGRAWSAAEIADMIAGAGGFAVHAEEGFALGRAIAGEAELITLAVAVGARRKGVGRKLLARFEDEAIAKGAETAFLEVAADNAAALALYGAAGWREMGRRIGYYARGAASVDALTMRKELV